MRIFSPKDPGESLPFALNFAGTNSDLQTGETLTSINSVTISLVSGATDPGMGAMLSGTAQISGTSVVQLIINGLVGNRYALTVLVTTSTGRILAEGGIIPIVPAYLQ